MVRNLKRSFPGSAWERTVRPAPAGLSNAADTSTSGGGAAKAVSSQAEPAEPRNELCQADNQCRAGTARRPRAPPVNRGLYRPRNPRSTHDRSGSSDSHNRCMRTVSALLCYVEDREKPAAVSEMTYVS